MLPVAIRVAMARKGLSQRDIARHLGISEQAISFILHGQRQARRSRKLIGELLGVDLDVHVPVRVPRKIAYSKPKPQEPNQ
ncbi:MAG: helix-turn-helix transcriptional regulator [Candidatus Electryoneaceae bacterium]|nr:helix-turn-helix transcriptional regulator [Candidatus Electryoneaceae bacterium]